MRSFWQGFEKQAKLKKDVELRPHQDRALARLEKKPGLLVYHGLGSGKTITSIAATEDGDTDVILPASLRENYKKEQKRFSTSKRNIMSFEKYVKDKPVAAKNLVIDEAHLVGRHEAKRSTLLTKRAPDYEKRVLLTGTPVRNHPSELAPLLNIIRGDKEIPALKKEFSEKFINELTKKPGFFGRLLGRTPSTTYQIKNPGKFQSLIQGYVDYHPSGDDKFPSVTEERIEVPLGPEQQKIYKYLVGKVPPGLRHKIKRGLPPSKQESKSLNAFMSGTRQVSNTARPFGGTEESKIEHAVEELVTRGEKDKNFKAVVYSNFLGAGIQPYAEKLKAKNIPHAVFDGSLSDKDRAKLVKDYNKNKIKALLLSGAGSQGLDLKGTKLVQLLEPHWNEARLEQAKGRAIRYKSHDHLPEKERHVHVQRYFSTLQPGLLGKLLGKRDFSSDEYLDMLSKVKAKLNEAFLELIRKEGVTDVARPKAS